MWDSVAEAERWWSIPARYPNGLPGGVPFMAFGKDQAITALDAAERFLRLASEHISGDASTP